MSRLTTERNIFEVGSGVLQSSTELTRWPGGTRKGMARVFVLLRTVLVNLTCLECLCPKDTFEQAAAAQEIRVQTRTRTKEGVEETFEFGTPKHFVKPTAWNLQEAQIACQDFGEAIAVLPRGRGFLLRTAVQAPCDNTVDSGEADPQVIAQLGKSKSPRTGPGNWSATDEPLPAKTGA